MTRTDISYGQLDRGLRALGFSCRPALGEPPARLYEHAAAGALIVLPAFPEQDRVLDYHLAMVRTMLDEFGITDPTGLVGEVTRAG